MTSKESSPETTHFGHFSYKDIKERGWDKEELIRCGWRWRDACRHWAPTEWEDAMFQEDAPLMLKFLSLPAMSFSPQQSCDLYMRNAIKGGRYNEKFQRFISDCKKTTTPALKAAIIANHRDALSAFIAQTPGLEPYRADLFITPKAFKWFPKLVWAHMQLFNDEVGWLIKRTINNRKPGRSYEEKYKIRYEFNKLQSIIPGAVSLYRSYLDKSGSIDKALKQTKNKLAREKNPLARKKYWYDFSDCLKSDQHRRIAKAEIAAEIVAKANNDPKLKSLLLSGKLL